MSLPKRLDMALAYAGLSGADASQAVGRSHAYVSDILRGKSQGGSHLGKLAELLNVDPLWLRDGTGSPPPWITPDPPRPTIVTGGQGLRVVGVVSAGDGKVRRAEDERGDPFTEASDPFPIPDSWDVVQVKGDSAYPVAYNGQFAVIDTARTATPGTLDPATLKDLDDNLVLIQTREQGEVRAYLKRFCADPRSPCGYTLASVNAGRGSPYLPPESIDLITPVVGVVFEDPRRPREKGRVRPPSDPAIQPAMEKDE